MKKIFVMILAFILFTVSSVYSEDKYDDEGNLIPDTEVQLLFAFPDVGVGAVFDFNSNRLISIINIEILDTDDSPNLIPLKIKKMPKLLDIVSDVFVGDGIIGMGVGVRFLPLLEPSALVWGGYNFNDGCEAFGVGFRFGIKF